MASGKTITLGNLKVNFSKRGIAAKKAGADKVWRMQYPWYKTEEEKEAARQASYEQYAEEAEEEDEDYDEEEDGEVYGKYDGLLNSKWLLWLLLIVLPPLGVWLLWRQKRYEITTRTIISGAAVIWFIILLILLFNRLGRSNDTTVPIATRAPAATVDVTVDEPAATPTVAPTVASTPTTAPSPTPLTAAAATPAPTEAPEDDVVETEPTPVPSDDNTYIFCTAKGKYYHAYATCSGMQNASKVLVSVAKGMGKTACPVCLKEDGLTPINASSGDNSGDSGDTGDDGADAKATATPKPSPTPTKAASSGEYYATKGGVYYHKNPDCSGMTNASSITAAKAIALGKKPCPTCVGSVYATPTGQYYHKTSNCSGMQGATLVTVAAAKKRGQTPCPVCIGDNGTVYYATATGKYYHVLANCSGMQNAARTTVATAKKRGQTPCPVCIGTNATTYYYATKNGKYYHVNQYCSNMAGAERVTLAVARSEGKTACPVCIPAATNTTQATESATYYSTANGKYYHKTATCSGMQNATEVTAAIINQRGQTACPVCLGNVVSYYSTPDGKYYHKTANCSGMMGADKVSYATALKRGQTACPVCLGGTVAADAPAKSTATKYYYGTSGGKYYHAYATCSGMQNATRITLAQAKAAGQTACPNCLASVVSYYSTPDGRYYHKTANCSGMTGADKVSYATALKRGQTPCPVCLGGRSTSGKSASTKTTATKYYYATKNGRYYHTRANCSGMTGASKVSLTAALANGQTACPVCAGGKATTSTRTTTKTTTTKTTTTQKKTSSGTDDNVTVWVTGDKLYHSRQYCGTYEDAVATTLGYAKSHGYTRCTACNAPS